MEFNLLLLEDMIVWEQVKVNTRAMQLRYSAKVATKLVNVA